MCHVQKNCFWKHQATRSTSHNTKWNNLFPLYLGRCRLKHAGRRHEILYVLAKHLVFRPQLQILLFDAVHSLRQVVQCVLQFKHLGYQPCLFFLFIWAGIWLETVMMWTGTIVSEGWLYGFHTPAMHHAGIRLWEWVHIGFVVDYNWKNMRLVFAKGFGFGVHVPCGSSSAKGMLLTSSCNLEAVPAIRIYGTNEINWWLFKTIDLRMLTFSLMLTVNWRFCQLSIRCAQCQFVRIYMVHKSFLYTENK